SPPTPGGPGPGRRKRPSATYGRPSGICPLRSSRRSRNAADPAHGSRITGRRRTRRDDDARLPPNRRPPGRDRSGAADLRDVLTTIAVPTLLIYGDADVRSPADV